jgi:hypothetical protein
MNVASYYLEHVIPTGIDTFRAAFRVWCDLILDRYEDYSLQIAGEDPYTECREWFWHYLNTDQTLSKHFLEDLQRLVDQIDEGEIELIPFSSIETMLESLDGDV